MIDIIKSEVIGTEFSISIQYFGRGIGYEICVAKLGVEGWYETDGHYSTKKAALQVYKVMKEEYKLKAKEELLVKCEIENFILFWSSDDVMRERMRSVLKTFMREVYE